MRYIACFALVFVVLWLPYRLAVQSEYAALRLGFPGFEFSADQAAASPVLPASSTAAVVAPPRLIRQEEDLSWPPVGQSDSAVHSSRSDDWMGVDGRAPVVQITPNPSEAGTLIAFTLPHASLALVRIYSAYGREVATLADDYREEGTYLVTFDGSQFPAGRYVCVLETSSATVAKEIVLSP